MFVECGVFHTLCLSKPGKVYAWGAGLGLGFIEEGDSSIYSTPHILQSIESTILTIAAGPYHSAAVTIHGDLLCWGYGSNNRLGHGDQNNQASPKFVAALRSRLDIRNICCQPSFLSTALSKKNVVVSAAPFEIQPHGVYSVPRVCNISCGKRHSILLTSTGNVWVWGANKYGQLGLGSNAELLSIEHNEPALLDKFTEPIRNVACGSYHSVAVGVHGGAFSWGRNNTGQLGLGMTNNSFIPSNISTIQNVLNVFAGDDFSACIAGFTGSNQKLGNLNYGELWMWGSAESGKLGLGEEFSSNAILLPKKVETKFPIWKCALGESHTLAITAKGEMLAWGAGYYGRLGTGSLSNVHTPLLVKFPQKTLLRDVAAGSSHSLAVSIQNDIWVWGKADCICHTQDQVIPVLFEEIKTEAMPIKAKKVVAARSHSFVLSEQNEIWAWGDNEFFQLSFGKMESTWIPVPKIITTLPAPANIISAGPQHCVCALETHNILQISNLCARNDEVYSWGCAKKGILGIGAQKRNFLFNPSRIDPRWVSVEHSLLNFSAMSPEDQNSDEQQELAVVQVQQILFQLTLQSAASQTALDWSVIQQLLIQEESENTAKQIEVLEDDLIHLLGHHLNFILDLKNKEMDLHTLQDAYHTRPYVCYSLQLFDTFVLIPHDAPRVSCSSIFTSKFEQLEEFVWIFQQQPAYFLNLLSCCLNDESKEEILECIYRDLEDPHVNHLVACLLRALAKRQVFAICDVHLLCSNDHSMFLKAFQSYALSPFNLMKYASALIDMKNPTLLYVLHISSITIFLPGLVPSSDSKAKEMLRAEFHTSLDHLSHILTSTICPMIAGLSLPHMLCVILKNLYESIVSAGLIYDALGYPNGADAQFFMPITKVFLCAIIVPVLRDSDYFIEKCGYTSLPIDGFLQHNLQSISVFIEMGCCNTFSTFSSGFLLKTIADNFFVEALPIIRYHCSVVDSLDAQLIFDIYRTHLDLDDSFITIRSDKLAGQLYIPEFLFLTTNLKKTSHTFYAMVALLNACKRYETRLNLSAHDPVSKLIQNIGEGSNPPVDEQSLHLCKSTPLWYTYRTNRRYILQEPNLVFCSLTGAPVPQRLSPRQQPYQKKGQRLMSLLLRYIPPDKYDPRLAIQQCLKICPPVSGKSWSKLQKELGLIAEYATSLRIPNYELANLVYVAGKSIEDAVSKTLSVQDVQRWISEGILARKHHRNYLRNVQVLETQIATLEIEYNRKLQLRVEEIRAALSSCELLSYENNIQEHAKKFGVHLAFASISHLKKQVRIKKKLDLPCKDFSYQNMMNFQVIDWISPRIVGNQNQFLSNLRFIISATSAGDWKMEIYNPLSQEKIHLYIDSKKLNMMRRSPYESCFTFFNGEEGELNIPQCPVIRIRGQQMARLLYQIES
ncbi:regulator of chromosome condensation (RCC1) repeat-containing protein [Cardiosporidium cionae]|uniref:Regulator of chromosome condensation (RCC1) repeat-containing protein n=1 Tax=Cardiosporidium cionae TaxID=476202 RepID=A0ABQ7J984_9APIC|nr:regulator of chromosome condensation (RCC1) repeat-containing protein [Cardiosporidium cionae]|eukprot:KAF8820556.1 regulator of chromosome condensation (RCC1) repeat-containing protein [Cardiosporidium cionae]